MRVRLDKLRLMRKLSGGSADTVYLAVYESLGHEAAFRLGQLELLFFWEVRKQFRRDIEAEARLEY